MIVLVLVLNDQNVMRKRDCDADVIWLRQMEDSLC